MTDARYAELDEAGYQAEEWEVDRAGPVF